MEKNLKWYNLFRYLLGRKTGVIPEKGRKALEVLQEEKCCSTGQIQKANVKLMKLTWNVHVYNLTFRTLLKPKTINVFWLSSSILFSRSNYFKSVILMNLEYYSTQRQYLYCKFHKKFMPLTFHLCWSTQDFGTKGFDPPVRCMHRAAKLGLQKSV